MRRADPAPQATLSAALCLRPGTSLAAEGAPSRWWKWQLPQPHYSTPAVRKGQAIRGRKESIGTTNGSMEPIRRIMLASEQIDALVSALPGCTSGHRRELLPRVLEKWGRTDLEEHLERATPERVRAEHASAPSRMADS